MGKGEVKARGARLGNLARVLCSQSRMVISLFVLVLGFAVLLVAVGLICLFWLWFFVVLLVVACKIDLGNLL
ncbi:hypothetical protein HanXRQr2_Chr14g0662351 [Helianthus annuus]|uniref:Transmembrane protein n=1 Tax=Helianthus annuus TaxID=4232 RepID=A0A9K3H7N7_HELAN|nr:hypothetical protein HanXRQr2_Chr14g0662351 [Helianthus annuus]KAJ0841899.1 hypothetical protein HanPSC8_Chr14g0635621 [Helianthus annuus]